MDVTVVRLDEHECWTTCIINRLLYPWKRAPPLKTISHALVRKKIFSRQNEAA